MTMPRDDRAQRMSCDQALRHRSMYAGIGSPPSTAAASRNEFATNASSINREGSRDLASGIQLVGYDVAEFVALLTRLLARV
jgi:hypothetical protein